ncbi:hypothetical protein G6O69_21735 [Pseudenhygromyxa sp. WMMC2535]|uniref:hypothetical protein n=1 Tax=Pseudenhygromyxa sp. WMMC2535 TaxID=2712867 RepID=UPI001554B95F|nr:hypothetical protein [Pseudenhygromyxa sp. WMMC2535]NVB40477.1 hypothetical protein [Pseudenhygromyxa sp. WMMC2535]
MSPDPGLCKRCLEARRIVSAKGSSFWRCAVSERAPSWPKYPPLPVLRCPHYRPGEPQGSPGPR